MPLWNEKDIAMQGITEEVKEKMKDLIDKCMKDPDAKTRIENDYVDFHNYDPR